MSFLAAHGSTLERVSFPHRIVQLLAAAARDTGGSRRLRPDPNGGHNARRTKAHKAPRLALYHRPYSIALLDDAPDFLEQIMATMPASWNARAFLSPESFLNYLQQEPPRWEADFWTQQKLVENWHNGVPLIPQILQYWASTPERFELTQVCVLAHLMRSMSGLEVLEDLVHWPGYRVLLTGAYDQALATDAFNRGTIDQFISKQSAELLSTLVQSIQMHLERPNPRFHQIWSATLRPEQLAVLREPSAALDLVNFAAKSFTEWVVIGEPFGILGVSDVGAVSWLQLEPTSELNGLAEIAEQNGASAEDVAHIRAGRCVYDSELQQALGSRTTPIVTPAFYVGTTGKLLAGIHRIDPNIGSPDNLSYRKWLERNRQG